MARSDIIEGKGVKEFKMKEIIRMYTRYSKRADDSVGTLLKAIDIELLNETGKTFCGSIMDLYRHITGAVLYFHGLIRASIPQAAHSLAESLDPKLPDGPLNAEGLKTLMAAFSDANQATIDFVDKLSEGDLALPVKLDWYPDRETVPLHFVLNQLFVHGIHHRGQISQILDQLKVEHDFSGIDLLYIPE